MTAPQEADHKLSLSEDVFTQGQFEAGMEFHASQQSTGAMILRPKLKGFECLRGRISMSEDFNELL